ncbi:MAG TPA: right-handed parallel beta-helix repeat-containing protein, partial [Candidatus Binatia bacterium]
AVNAAQGGDTVRIQPGTYSEQILVSGKNNTAAAGEADRIVIEADFLAPPGGVVIAGSAGGCGGYAMRLKRSKFITIRGLTITGAGGTAVELLGGSNQNAAVRIEQNRIFGNGLGGCNGGVAVGPGNTDTLIVNNLVYGNRKDGISIAPVSESDADAVYIVENTIHANQWNGVDIGSRQRAFLVNNIITGNGAAPGGGGGRFGVRRQGASGREARIHLVHNLICGNRLGELDGGLLDPATDAGNLTPGGSEGPGVGASPGCDLPAAVYANLNGRDGAPNTDDDDFRPAASSPAVDMGTDPRALGLNPAFDPLFLADFADGIARPAGAAGGAVAFDAGAVEIGDLPPKASDTRAGTTTGAPVSILLQGRDLDNFNFSFVIVDGPGHGSLGPLGAPTVIIINDFHSNRAGAIRWVAVTYTPAANYSGPDSFTFKVNDGLYDSNVATVSIAVGAP